MIPKNITKKHVLKALKELNKTGAPIGRASSKYLLLYNGKQYPPKLVVSIANKFANGVEHPSYAFSGGDETNKYLQKLGFTIGTKPIGG